MRGMQGHAVVKGQRLVFVFCALCFLTCVFVMDMFAASGQVFWGVLCVHQNVEQLP